MNIETNTDAAVDLLRKRSPDGPWSLTAIPPSKQGIYTRAFATLEQARAFIEEHNGKSNLYFPVNPIRQPMNKKPSAGDISHLAWLHVDLDPRAGEDIDAERSRILGLLCAHDPEPTCIIDSGGGYQGFWRLEEPVPVDDPEQAKLWNMALERELGGDCCHNIDRIMRLPGTINLPDAKKAAKGRVPALARLVEFTDATYSIDQFVRAELPSRRTAAEKAVPHRIEDLSELDKWSVPARVKVIIGQGRVPDEHKDGDDSRSAWLFDAVCNLVRCGVPDETILGTLLDPDWGISESVLELGRGAEKYALRQIDKARETVAASDARSLQCDSKGVPYPNPHNIRVAMEQLGVRLSHDQFADRLLVEGLPGFGPALQDEAVARLWLTIDERYAFRPTKDLFWTVVEDYARQHGFHPVRDYLDGLTWDGTPRVDTWLSQYGNAEDTEYTRAVGALFLLAAVRRARQPGCKFDEMLVLRSPQGTGKSSALEALCPHADWFGDELPLNADTKVVIERLHGRWIVEAAELKGMRRGDVEHLKAFLSRQMDRARMAYGRVPKEVPRQCVIAGTTNSEQFLRDTTGNRRFWPVEVGEFDARSLATIRDQLWAEAGQREAAGESIRLDPSLYPVAAEAQERHRIEDPFEGRLAEVLGDCHGKIKAEDAWTIIGVPSGQRTQEHKARLGEAMRRLGWKRTKLRFGGPNPEWCYARGSKAERIHIYAAGDDVHAEVDSQRGAF
jgi:hypothetical protein